MVATSPAEEWAKYLKKLTLTTPEQKVALQKAKALAAIIQKRRSGKPEDHAKLVEKSFNELADQIKILNSGKDTPSSVVEYSGTNAQGGGVEAKASVLSSVHPPGSGPKDYADIWKDLKHLGKGVGRPVRQNWYVQGHLLNENLGGPGMRFNLLPITKAANNKHKDVVETTLKDMVTSGEVISYTVKALDPPPKGKNPRRAELEAKAKLRPDEVDELESLKALAKLPSGFKCTAYVLKPDSSKKWTKKTKALDKATTTIENNIEEGGKTYGY
jgi:hypothetical protein